MAATHHPEITAGGPRPLSELAYELITDKIIRLDFPPGSALVEKSLMEELDLGRTPIREALQRLTVEGLVCRTHYSGVYVCEVTEDSVASIAEFRLTTDPIIARLATQRCTDDGIDELEENLALLRAHHIAGRQDGYTHASRRFYATLSAQTGNLHLIEAAKNIYNFDARLLYFAARSTEDWNALTQMRIDNASEVLDCMRRRNSQEAEAVVRLYLVRYFDRVSALLRRHEADGGRIVKLRTG
ncbi:MAG: GntR family transcriptional regulator [Roseovarius sp.]